LSYEEESIGGVLSEVLSEVLKNEKNEKKVRNKCPSSKKDAP
jgi:hypothetical protein